jgi:hypothetical protein
LLNWAEAGSCFLSFRTEHAVDKALLHPVEEGSVALLGPSLADNHLLLVHPTVEIEIDQALVARLPAPGLISDCYFSSQNG